MSSPYDKKLLSRLHWALRANSPHTQFSFLTTFSKNLAVRISIRELIGKRWKNFWQSSTIFAVFAKVGRVASEEVTLQLIKAKCLPALLYGLEACPLSQISSLLILWLIGFVINRFFMKLFTTKNIEIVKYCQEYFGFALPSVLWAKRVSKFESSFKCFDWSIIVLFWLYSYCLLLYHICLVNKDPQYLPNYVSMLFVTANHKLEGE